MKTLAMMCGAALMLAGWSSVAIGASGGAAGALPKSLSERMKTNLHKTQTPNGNDTQSAPMNQSP